MTTTDLAGERWPAPAKLNLFLHITGQRADGYHELQTLFQLLDWGDELQIIPRQHPNISRHGPDYGVPEEQDLAIRAARLLQTETACRLGADIRVTKNVPMGSGMGRNGEFGCGHGVARIEPDVGLWSGHRPARCPRCTAGRGRTRVWCVGALQWQLGIGDRLEPVELGARHYVLVFPGISIATSAVFSDPALKRDSGQLGLDAGAGRQGPERLRSGCETTFSSHVDCIRKALCLGASVDDRDR